MTGVADSGPISISGFLSVYPSHSWNRFHGIEDQNVVIGGGKITVIGMSAALPTTNEHVTVLDLRRYSVMPGIVGTRNHLYYKPRPNLKH